MSQAWLCWTCRRRERCSIGTRASHATAYLGGGKGCVGKTCNRRLLGYFSAPTLVSIYLWSLLLRSFWGTFSLGPGTQACQFLRCCCQYGVDQGIQAWSRADCTAGVDAGHRSNLRNSSPQTDFTVTDSIDSLHTFICSYRSLCILLLTSGCFLILLARVSRGAAMEADGAGWKRTMRWGTSARPTEARTVPYFYRGWILNLSTELCE